MRKFLAAALIAGLGIIPAAAIAGDIDDAKHCRDGEAQAVRLGITSNDPTDVENADRGSVCVNDPNGQPVLYIGGEVQSEENGNPQYGGACGSIMVGGTNVTGSEEDWAHKKKPNGTNNPNYHNCQ